MKAERISTKALIPLNTAVHALMAYRDPLWVLVSSPRVELFQQPTMACDASASAMDTRFFSPPDRSSTCACVARSWSEMRVSRWGCTCASVGLMWGRSASGCCFLGSGSQRHDIRGHLTGAERVQRGGRNTGIGRREGTRRRRGGV